ncbi:hypothetical protein PX699_01595 [Sphingobium sp. H39-3-25]|uniref:hypothetical protein n=1 Tax=Sphingobium arseniciresistens TaxID=3030834 RepID=UPI0023B95D34|nr:hypothetical protein [Sphingobium arseniciresistens]
MKERQQAVDTGNRTVKRDRLADNFHIVINIHMDGEFPRFAQQFRIDANLKKNGLFGGPLGNMLKQSRNAIPFLPPHVDKQALHRLPPYDLPVNLWPFLTVPA